MTSSYHDNLLHLITLSGREPLPFFAVHAAPSFSFFRGHTARNCLHRYLIIRPFFISFSKQRCDFSPRQLFFFATTQIKLLRLRFNLPGAILLQRTRFRHSRTVFGRGFHVPPFVRSAFDSSPLRFRFVDGLCVEDDANSVLKFQRERIFS
ncbi:unnamed protein product [Vicia faba]|uniref:Uncharacterized protein n=1 Tax=Vicia faba TaxID=3906 RepID=A0AAV0YQQ9_VICFA|nr:unnamed protein product [Vicia faba]